jgi:histidine triad (HIT) family protein
MTIFDKIIAKEIPSQVEYEDEHSLVFHDINPQAPIHLLAIPKKSGIVGFDDVDCDTMGHLIKAIQEVVKRMGLDKTGYRLVTNNGEDAGQEVPHIHFHILGGTKLGHVHHKDATKSNL